MILEVTVRTGFAGRRQRIRRSGFWLSAGLAAALVCGHVEAQDTPAQDTPAQTQTAPAPMSAPDAGTVDVVPATMSASPHLILVAGAAGEEKFGAEFSKWADRWEKAAAASGVDATVIGRNSSTDTPLPEVSTTEATPANAASVKEADSALVLSAIQTQLGSGSTEPLWIVYLGHGTFNGKSASWALQGPDLSDVQLSEALKNCSRPLVVAVCSSCSAPFVNALSGPGRVIVTATKDGSQIQYSRFGDAFSEAIAGLDADTNRDGQTSLLEAWLYASRRTAEFYKTEGRLATEHSLLEDNGDAKGVRAELFTTDKPTQDVKADGAIDGTLAAKQFFVRSEEERRLTPEQRLTRDALEARLEDLQRRRNTMDEQDYLQQLEQIMIPLARLYEEAESPATAPPVTEPATTPGATKPK